MSTARTLASRIAELAAERPQGIAYLDDFGALSWAQYDVATTRFAAQLVAAGTAPGERVAVLLPDGRAVHAAFVAIEKAGAVAVGIGPRAGPTEIEHLLRLSGATALVSRAQHRELDLVARVAAWRDAGIPLRQHWRLEDEVEAGFRASGEAARPAGEASTGADAAGVGRAVGPEALFLLNSTSGTTGLPKCVCHHQARWFAFHAFAVETGALCADDVFMSVVPAPFGFGLWTSHFTPTILGVPTVVSEHFDAGRALTLLAEHRVTVLAAVSTQFMMMLASPRMAEVDLSALRVLYTGGEAVPFERAAEFEDRTGAAVLQFYGSNEVGAVSGTRLDDPRDKRLATAGRIVSQMQVRLFDEAGNDVTETGEGEPGCKGPTLSLGYYGDPDANAALTRAGGWMRVQDRVTLDEEGYLRVVGRTGDFIIRGGKNISAPAVEAAVIAHPAVAVAAAVAMPDPVFGERVCVFVELRPGETLELQGLCDALLARGVSKELLPERLEVMAELPRGSGGKIAKQPLREALAGRSADREVAR